MNIRTSVKKTSTIQIDMSEDCALDLILEGLKAKDKIPHSVRCDQAELITDTHGDIMGLIITVVENVE